MTSAGNRSGQPRVQRPMPTVESVGSGVWSIPVPIPHSSLRYTLCYLLACQDGFVMVDPGWPSDAGFDALSDAVASIGAELADVVGIAVTHAHSDHHGLSERVRNASGAWIAMHKLERDALPARRGTRQSRSEADSSWLERSGVPASDLPAVAMPEARIRLLFDLVEPDIVVEDGEWLPIVGRRLNVVGTPGHTPGHMCLYDEESRSLLAGDHVLPRITPNVGHSGQSDLPELENFLHSLKTVAAFDGAQVLPAHEYRFDRLSARLRAIRDHHVRRCEEIITLMEGVGQTTVWDLARRLTWARPWSESTGWIRRGALAETEAHLRYLRDGNRVRAVPGKPTEWSLMAGTS
jgi:glyoxylase-like metal-dependent hydrolase (beta-lactamase superfamily II)